MIINAIAAIGDQNQLAFNNELPWHYPEDLKLFKEKVKGKTVLMGRKTFESMPKSFFKTVTTVVITSQVDEYELAAESLEAAIDLASDLDESEIWILGGASIYKEAIEKKLIDKLHISHIPYEGPADRFFPNFIPNVEGISHGETIHSPSNDKSFRYKVYEMEKNRRNHNGMLDFEGSFIRPVARSGLAQVLIPSMGYSNNAVVTTTSSDITFADHPMPGLSGSTIQDALNEIVINSPEWISMDSELNTPGQIRYREGMVETMTSDGEIVRITDFDGPAMPMMSIKNASQALCDIVQGEINRYTDSVMDSSEMYGIGSTLRDRIHTAIKEHDPESSIHINMNYRTEMQREPVYLLGHNQPVDFSHGRSSTTITIGLIGIFMDYAIDRLELELHL